MKLTMSLYKYITTSVLEPTSRSKLPKSDRHGSKNEESNPPLRRYLGWDDGVETPHRIQTCPPQPDCLSCRTCVTLYDRELWLVQLHIMHVYFDTTEYG